MHKEGGGVRATCVSNAMGRLKGLVWLEPYKGLHGAHAAQLDVVPGQARQKQRLSP